VLRSVVFLLQKQEKKQVFLIQKVEKKMGKPQTQTGPRRRKKAGAYPLTKCSKSDAKTKENQLQRAPGLPQNLSKNISQLARMDGKKNARGKKLSSALSWADLSWATQTSVQG
jgi:hypothetical protein